MQFRSIPQTDLQVSVICLGTMTFGNPVPTSEAITLVHWALDQGINLIDTADMYEGYDRRVGSAGGVAEGILGSALCDRRHRAIVVTKVGSDVGGKGLGRSHILRQIEGSLKRLRTEYVDIYEMHKSDPETPLAESIEVMAELVVAGKIRHWGFSNFNAQQIGEMITLCDSHGWPRPVVSQPPYSWLKREVEADHLPLCRKLNIAVTPYQPFQAGLLTGKYRRSEPIPAGSRAAESPAWLHIDNQLFDQLSTFEDEARATCLKPSQYAIHWLLSRPGITSIVVGARGPDQLVDAITSAELPLMNV